MIRLQSTKLRIVLTLLFAIIFAGYFILTNWNFVFPKPYTAPPNPHNLPSCWEGWPNSEPPKPCLQEPFLSSELFTFWDIWPIYFGFWFFFIIVFYLFLYALAFMLAIYRKKFKKMKQHRYSLAIQLKKQTDIINLWIKKKN